MKHVGLLVFVVWLARLAAGGDGQDEDDHPHLYPQDDAKISCRVAVCLSGHVRSFVSPAVHLSVRRNVIEAMRGGGCTVDVFAYAALEDTGEFMEQEEQNPDYTPNMGDVEASIQTLAPTRLVWHQEQAGIIPSSCPDTLHWNTSAKNSAVEEESSGTSEDDWMRKNRDEDRPNLYWQLYMSRAAYHMALEEESEEGFTYDWIVHTRFDATWIRPIPPLSLFSREAVWLDASSWPASDDFALVPRALSDRFFSAVSTFYACDESSAWPPGESWWNPHCDGKGFGETVLFRHLHALEVDYRTYPMFDYVPTLHEKSGKNCDTRKSAYYTSACILLDTWGLLPASFSGANCTSALSEWSDLRCETLMSDAGMGEQRKAEAVLHPDTRAWEQLLGTLAVGGSGEAGTQDIPFPEKLRLTRLKLAALRDAVLLLPLALDEISLDTLESRQSKRDRWEMSPAWLIHTQEGCHIEEHAGRAPHLVRYYVVDPPLAEEMALAMKCLANRLVEGTGAAGAGFDATICAHVRPLELVMIDVSARSGELGVCTVDSSLGLSTGEYVRQFFSDPAAHCVGYGRMMMRQSPATPRGGAGDEVDATVHNTVAEALSRSSEEGAVIHGAPVTGATVPEAGEISSATAEAIEAVVAALEPSPEDAPVSHFLREYGIAMASVGDPDSWEGSERATTTSTTSAACSDLMVQAMTVVHPKEGAVYWEGPVTVELEVTLTGSGLRGLDPRDVHICADTEEAWPILDWSRTCISLDQLASPDRPFLVFGSTIGVVVGSVSVRDARPACTPEGSLRGPVLPMAGGGDGEIASEPVRFKVVHHKSTLERRGRPLGASPLGRGFTTTEGYIQDLEREADEESSVARDEMQSYINLTHGLNIELRGERCQSKLDIHQRGSSLIASSFQLQFLVEQLDWMLANGKLPSEMVVAADRMRELLPMFLDETTPSFFSMFILDGMWRSVAPFFQKTLLVPAPALDRVVSTTPLHTWEYDEIPWMEALNPEVDWDAVEQAYLGNTPVELAYVDNFFSPKALAVLLDMAYGSTFFFDNRHNYIGAYPSDGMSHPLLYQIAEEAAERLPRIVGRDSPGWPLVQSWIYIYGGNDGQRCSRGIKVHADTAIVNLNVWLAPDSANLGSPETDDGGGLTVFHAKPPNDWSFQEFNRDPDSVMEFLGENDAGNTSTPHRQNRALLFDSMLFHQSDPFRFKKGFDNKRINLTLLFGRQKKPTKDGEPGGAAAAAAEPSYLVSSENWYTSPQSMREVPPEDAGALLYCL